MGEPLVYLFGLAESSGELVCTIVPFSSVLFGPIPANQAASQVNPSSQDLLAYVIDNKVKVDTLTLATDCQEIIATRQAWSLTVVLRKELPCIQAIPPDAEARILSIQAPAVPCRKQENSNIPPLGFESTRIHSEGSFSASPSQVI